MHLFTVEQTFLITGSDLLLRPGLIGHEGRVTAGSPIKLVFPDKTEAETIIKGVVFENLHIAIPPEWADRVGPGVEVWTID
jgi:hypothetical protein